MGVAGSNPSSAARIMASLTRGAQIASAAAIAIGAIACWGWILGIPALVRLFAACATMKFNAGLALILLGVALRLSIPGPVRPATRRGVRALAIAVLVIAAATLVEYGLDVDLRLDQLLVRDLHAGVAPGRMSPVTAGSLLALAAAVLWLESRWAVWLGLVTALSAHVVVLCHLYGVSDLYAIGPYATISTHTALALYALAAAVVLARPQRAAMRLVVNNSPGGLLARRLLPAALIVPAVLALLRQWGEHAGLYGAAFGSAMLVAANSATFVGLIAWTAIAILRSDEQRRAAEEAVRDHETYLATTLDSIGDGVIATDEHKRIVRMNAVAERLTGWPSYEAVGRPLPEVFRIVDEDTGVLAESPAERVLRHGVVVGLTNHTQLIARDGTRRAIADSGAPIRDAGGTARGVMLVFRDQSETRAAERRLQDSEARKAAILESAMDAIISVDGASIIRELNPAAEAMFGRSRDVALGTPLVDCLARGPGRDELAALLAASEPQVLGARVELTAVHASGTTFPVEVSITRVGRGDPASYTVLLRDLTEAYGARAELIRSTDRLRALAAISDAFAAVATTYQPLIDEIARTVADILGDGCLVTLISEDGERLYNAANAHRDPVLELDYKEYLSQMAVQLMTSCSVSAEVARTGLPIRADVTPEAIAPQSEDVLRPLLARLNVYGYAVVPMRARQTVIGTLSVLRNAPDRSYTEEDVTLLQDLADRAGLAIENARLYARLEQRVHERTAELESANEELESFSYSVAHDLRAPLRVISGFSHALLDDAADRLTSDDVRHATHIHEAASRMGELIDDLLELSRISRTEPRRRRVDLSELARSVLAGLRAEDPARDVETAIADGLVAHADPRLLGVVLTNLLGNAWKFTGRRSQARIELGVRPGERPTVYFVRDNGAGFDPAHATKLFGAFQRLHTAQEFEGTGIGLVIVRRIVQRHGGRVWAEAEVDRGATFYFTLESALTDRAALPRSPS